MISSDLLFSLERMPAADRQSYEVFFREVIRQRGFPLHTSSLWNALYFGWSLERHSYLGRGLRMTLAQDGAGPIPVGAFLEVPVGNKGLLWAEVTYKEGRSEQIDDLGIVAPEASGQRAGLLRAGVAADVREALVLDFEALGDGLSDADEVTLVRAQRRLVLTGENHKIVVAHYEAHEAGLDDLTIFAHYLFDRYSDQLFANLLRDDGVEVPSEARWELLLGSLANVEEIANGTRGLRTFGSYHVDDVTYRADCARSSDAPFGGDALRGIASAAAAAPVVHAPRGFNGWHGADVSAPIYRSTGGLVSEYFHRDGLDPAERDLLTGPSYARLVLESNLAIADHIGTDGIVGATAIRLDDEWQGGGVWRAVAFHDAPPPETHFAPLVALGMGYAERSGLAGISSAAAETGEPEAPERSERGWRVPLRRIDLECRDLALAPEAVAMIKAGADTILVEIDDGITKARRKPLPLDRERRFVRMVPYPPRFAPGTIVTYVVGYGGILLTLHAELLPVPVEIEGQTLCYRFNERIFREAARLLPLDRNALAGARTLADQIVAVLNRRGRPTPDGVTNLKVSESRYDGLSRETTVISYRCPGAAVGGCASGTPSITVSQEGTNAAAAVDNYADALAGNEVAWSQSEDQYFASVRDTNGANPDLYKTRYVYDGYHHVIDTIAPSEVNSDYRKVAAWQDSIKATYPMSEGSGATLTSYSGSYQGTYYGNPSWGTQGTAPYVRHDAALTRAVTFNGTSQYAKVTGSSLGTISGSFTLEAWVKLSSTADIARSQTFLGTRSGSGQVGFDVKFSKGNLVHADIGSTSAWLNTAADADFVYKANRWYHIAYTVGAGIYTVYVDGVPIGSGFYSGTPILTDSSHNLCIGQACNNDTSEYFDGSISGVSVFTTSLDENEIREHYLSAIGIAEQHSQPSYDRQGRVVAQDDEGLANAGFETGLWGWKTSGSVAANVVTSPSDPTVHYDANAPVPSFGSLKLTAANAKASQTFSLVPGQTFRFQVWHTSSATSAVATVSLKSWNSSHTAVALLDATFTQTAWTGNAWDVTVPADGDGRVELSLSETGTGTVYFDDAVIVTKWSQARYATDTGSVIYGLPTDALTFSVVGAAGGGTGTLATHYDYTASSGCHCPGIFPTKTTANYVYPGTPHTADQNVDTTVSVDVWGRTTSAADADGVTSTTTYDTTSQTDVASTKDGLQNETTYQYDEVGHQTEVTTPKGEVTNTQYDLLGHTILVTGPTLSQPSSHRIATKAIYNNYGQLTQTIANYLDGTPSGASGADDVITSYVYDERGRATQTHSDSGFGAGIDARTDVTYDLFGNVVQSTLYVDATNTRVTKNVFDKASVTIGTTTYDVTHSKPTGSRGPLDGQATCPDGSGDHCNAVSVLDMNGRVTTSLDAYDTPTRHLFDLEGHAVRTVANYVDGVYNSGAPDEDIVTTTKYDIHGLVFSVIDVLNRETSTTSDALGHITKVTRPDNSWTRTDYTTAGRVAATSRPGAQGQTDANVAWTQNVYDLAGRQTATITNWDRAGNGAAQLQIATFEDGKEDGATGATNWAVSASSTVSASLGSATSGTANSGFGSLTVTPTSGSGSGASLGLTGTFKAGHTYTAVVYARASASGQSWRLRLGANGDSTQPGSGTAVATDAYTKLTVNWQAASDHSSGVLVAITDTADPGNASVAIDDVVVWDTGSADKNIYSLSVFDADGHPVASILPGGAAGDAPLVTRTSYDEIGRVTDVTTAAVGGAGESANDANLRTHSVYDDLGRATEVTNPKGIVSHSEYDRLGRLTASTLDYGTGLLNIRATAGYDRAGELIATCSPLQVAAGCATGGTDVRSWRYTYNGAGQQASATPPDNSFATDMATTSTSYELSGAGLVHQVVTGARTTTYTYDDLHRPTVLSVATTGVGTLTTTSTLDGAGRTTAIATSGTSSDSLTEAYDDLDRLTSISRAGTAITTYTYNPDGSAATRTDHDAAGTDRASSFTYTATGQLATATLPGSFGTAAYTWGLDANLATRTWGSSVSGTYTYDRAKRPIGLSIKFGASVSGSIARTYDRVGNALSETQTLSGVSTSSGLAGGSTATFAYDAANRLTSSYFGSSQSPVAPRAYTYDLDSNRTSVTESGTVFYYFYDATDELIKKGPNPDGSGASAFGYDALGQLLTSQPSLPGSGVVRPTTYAYDPVGHLSGITADGVTTSFTIDTLGRHAGQTVGANPTTTYAYLGTADTVSSSAVGGTLTTYSAIDAIGDRLTTGTPGAFAYVLPDLHGNVVATMTAGTSPVYSAAYRYDAYGETCDSYAPTGAITSPWRYQGRILESASGSTDLYDFAARSYDPSLGAFTSFDSAAGSAQNPLTLNRYLYANANPATLVDPDGHHATCDDDPRLCRHGAPPAPKGGDGGNGNDGNGTSCPDPTHYCGNNTKPGGADCWANNSCGDNPDAGAPPDGRTRTGLYQTCMMNAANNRSGTSPDSDQQSSLCAATVTSRFDSVEPDLGEQLKAAAFAACLIFCTAFAVVAAAVAVAAAPVAAAQGAVLVGGTDMLSQLVAKGNVDPAEVGVMSLIGAVTAPVGALVGLGRMANVGFNFGTGLLGNEVWSQLSGKGWIGDPKGDAASGISGGFCAVFKGALGVGCSIIAAGVQGVLNRPQAQPQGGSAGGGF